ncbi:hypothetical protein ACLKA6_004235 [Drosophila palustris]
MASTSRRGARRANTSQSQAAESQPEPQHDQIDQQVRAVLNFILCHSANKVPIKMTDLMSLTSGKNELAKRLPFITQLLNERYGIKLVLLEGAPKRYICLAESPAMSIYELKASQRPQYTMLYIILTYIFLRGNRIEEDKLYGMLDAMEVKVDEEHGYFGDDISKLIEETFVKQQYLKRERSQLSPYDDPKNYYSWGPRAKSEFTYQQIVQFASKLFDQDASFFQQQLMRAEGIDNPEMLQNLEAEANQAERSYFDLNDESQNG